MSRAIRKRCAAATGWHHAFSRKDRPGWVVEASPEEEEIAVRAAAPPPPDHREEAGTVAAPPLSLHASGEASWAPAPGDAFRVRARGYDRPLFGWAGTILHGAVVAHRAERARVEFRRCPDPGGRFRRPSGDGDRFLDALLALKQPSGPPLYDATSVDVVSCERRRSDLLRDTLRPAPPSRASPLEGLVPSTLLVNVALPRDDASTDGPCHQIVVAAELAAASAAELARTARPRGGTQASRRL